jgi:hypothetical protein
LHVSGICEGAQRFCSEHHADTETETQYGAGLVCPLFVMFLALVPEALGVIPQPTQRSGLDLSGATQQLFFNGTALCP